MDRFLYDIFHELEDKHWWFVARREIITDCIRKYPAQTRVPKILDIGCGTGLILKHLQQFGRVQGIDCSSRAIEYTNMRIAGGAVAKLGSLPNQIPFDSEKFNVITLLDVLEHIDNDQKSIEVVYSLLEKGGVLICTVPAYQFLWSNHDNINHHKRRYALTDLRNKLISAGFKIEKISHYNTILFPLIAGIRILKHLFRINAYKIDFQLPPKGVNDFLKSLFAFEKYLLRGINLPFGVSLLALARKP